MKTIRFTLLLFISVLLFSCGANKKRTSTEEMSITLREAWFPWAGYAGEIYAEKIGGENNINFKIAPGAEDIDPIKMVISGTNDFGIASAENLILANQKGAGLIAIGALNHKSATCFIALKDKNVNNLKDFENKKVGVLTATETETIYRLLLAKNDIDQSKIKEVEAPFDLTTFLATGAYDIRPAFVYDEAVTLDQRGVEYTMVRPEDYGVQMIGAVYFTTKKTVNENPEKVQAFVDVIAEGWKQALANPGKAIEMLKEYDPDIDAQRELASLQKGTEYFAGEENKVLFASDSTWNALKNDLAFLNKIPADFDINTCFDNSFINTYHEDGITER
ncbi:MAG: ABC transporter substrate-binding protein [bacterium]